ncbi:MAG TPA: hypothetical protein P5558_19755 [Geminicoccaceae bacterium]|jgi:hypothetical protein|nr:hypothetical protein [Geminicoccaceae bacterium]HRY26613.1 hypothetical protein [Geminicoccaceae bacterium]
MSWTCKLYRHFETMATGGQALSGLALITAFGACAPAAEGPPVPAPAPDNAVQVSPELYMVPAGEDDVGCPMFQPWSPTLMVVQALHWRSADGSFTLDRNAADCPPPT